MVGHHDIEEAAGAKGCDGEADRGEAHAEALMQVGTDEREGPPEDAAFEGNDDDDGEGPRPLQDAEHLSDHRSLGAFGPPGDLGPRAHYGE